MVFHSLVHLLFKKRLGRYLKPRKNQLKFRTEMMLAILLVVKMMMTMEEATAQRLSSLINSQM